MKKTFLVLFLAVNLFLIMGLKYKIDSISRYKVPGSSIIYIPSGKHLKYAAFGYNSLMADLIYLWAIQYFSEQTIWDRFENLEHVFSIISELDPRYYDPYDVGSLIAYYDAKDIDLAFKILDLGIEKNPDQWIFPLQAGHYAHMFAEDFERAEGYYKKAMDIKGSPPIARRLYANAAYERSDYQTAWQNWLEVYETSDDERVKKIASNHLYRTKATMDIQTINQAIAQFKNSHGRLPRELSELVTQGFLQNLPKDLDEKDYFYDGKTGDVMTRVNPWKR
ncbi:tetratricopeptide repeat protein [Acidobacteriota bacterium]